jgi:hypothetical protein
MSDPMSELQRIERHNRTIVGTGWWALVAVIVLLILI